MSDRDEAVEALALALAYGEESVDEADEWWTTPRLLAKDAVDALAAAGFTVTRGRYEPTQWVWSESEGAAFFRSSGWGDDEPLYRRTEGDTDG